MKKIIEINEGQPIEIDSSLGWLFCYREQFGHDIMPDLLPLLDAALGALNRLSDEDNVIEMLDEETVSRIIVALSSLEFVTIINILWAMNKNAGGLQNPHTFVNQFDVFPMDIIVPELFKTIVESSMSSKNSESLLKKIPTFSHSIQSQLQVSVED